ncbi:hypothetical protein V6N12_016151 [Hibiscus sabdariffa]|uniref:Uncharacterized protein n=1 Tax=Hibiscus sabdariffa TaxID=183260 RepID=A0ABR2C8V0_9ROSI
METNLHSKNPRFHAPHASSENPSMHATFKDKLLCSNMNDHSMDLDTALEEDDIKILEADTSCMFLRMARSSCLATISRLNHCIDRPLGHHHVSLCFAPLLDNPDDNGDVVQEPVAKFSVPSVPNVELAPRGSLPITAKGKAVLQLKTKVSHRLLSHIRVLLQTLVPNLNRIHRPPSSGHLLAFSMQLARNMLLFLMIGVSIGRYGH